jgi:hypothetical protein
VVRSRCAAVCNWKYARRLPAGELCFELTLALLLH